MLRSLLVAAAERLLQQFRNLNAAATMHNNGNSCGVCKHVACGAWHLGRTEC